jgi:chitinase
MPRPTSRFVVAAAVLLACGHPSRREAPAPQEPMVVAGYVAGWKTGPSGARMGEIAGEHLTHVIYAFGLIGEDGQAVLRDPCADIGRCGTAEDSARAGAGGNFAQLRRLEARHPHLRTLIALGGWTGSGRFSDVALTDTSRRRFVESVIDLYIRQHPGLFDGVDVDWEYPVAGGLATNVTRAQDRYNFTLLLAEFRRQLDVQGERDGKRYLLTAATSAGPRAITDLELVRVSELVDWLNVTTYDYHVGSRIAHFNAPLFPAEDDPTPFRTVDATLRRYLEGGVPRDKFVLGIPFFGRASGGVDAANAGLFQPADTAAPAPWNSGLDYRGLTGRQPEANGFTRHWHPVARVPWLYNPALRVWITYDDPQSIGEKGAYVRRHGLRGVIAWEVMGDDGTLTRAMAGSLRDARQ